MVKCMSFFIYASYMESAIEKSTELFLALTRYCID